MIWIESDWSAVMNNLLVKKNNFVNHFDIFLFIQIFKILVSDNLILIFVVDLPWVSKGCWVFECWIWIFDLRWRLPCQQRWCGCQRAWPRRLTRYWDNWWQDPVRVRSRYVKIYQNPISIILPISQDGDAIHGHWTEPMLLLVIWQGQIKCSSDKS